MPTQSDRLFLDTGYVIARFNRGDQYHQAAKGLSSLVSTCRELWTTDAVLLEVGAAFSHPDQRAIAIRLWDQFHGGGDPYHFVEANSSLLQQAMSLFRARTDKAWSLADCLSFVVMKRHQLTDALTADRHFVQAGFRALMMEDNS